MGKQKILGPYLLVAGHKVRRQQVLSVDKPFRTRALLLLLFSHSVGKMGEWKIRPYSFAPGLSFRFHCELSVKLGNIKIDEKRQGAYHCCSLGHQCCNNKQNKD